MWLTVTTTPTMIYVAQNKNTLDQSKSFHNSFKFLIKSANYLGLLPVKDSASASELRFSWKSWKTFYAIVTMMIYVVMTLICVVEWTYEKFSFNRLVRQLSEINAFISLVLYFQQAKKWTKFTQLWTQTDRKMQLVYGYPKNLDLRLKIVAVVTLIAAIGEYVLLFVYQYSIIRRRNRILDTEIYFRFVFPELFSLLPFNTLLACFAMFTTFLGHLIWSFNDLFIVALSTALALRFKQITDRLHADEKKANSNNYWIDIRADYDRLVHLSRKLDKYISYIVLLSYSANVFFLIIQLSNVLGHFSQKIQIFYYTYSFTFLLARLTTVSLYGAWVIDESKEPANCLHEVPSATYNFEIRRFLLQISLNDVGITGSKMFKVTRGLILSVAGAIVTYELVIIQFNNSEGLQ